MSLQGRIGRAGGGRVKRALGVQAMLEWAFRVEKAQLELPQRRDIDEGQRPFPIGLGRHSAHHRGNDPDEGRQEKPLLSSLEGMTSMYMASQPAPHTAQSIRDIIAQLRSTPMFAGQVEDNEAEELARLIEEKYGISMGLGAIVDAKDFRPWLHDARINGEVGDFYWGRYRQLLNLKGLPKSVIDATDEVTDRVLDRLGDPNNTSAWSRRGMVVGHVRSGKTQNYTGLICKAADAGYRLIVVIAGIHNNLRNQTQARIDRYVRTRPLLILRFVSPDAPDDLQSLLPQGNLLAWTISFPKSEIEGGTVEYIVNTIRMREMFGEDEIEEEALGDTD